MANDKFIATPTRTKQILSMYDFSFKKSLGQNFIIDVNVLKNMIQNAGIDKHSGVIEIGPGIGALTEQLAIHADQVIAFEIDERLLSILTETLQAYKNIRLLHQDILEADIKLEMKQSFQEKQDVHVVANLPYYITTPIIMKLLSDQLPITSITIMIQKEVAERIVAKPGTKAYGSLSIAVQYYTDPEIVMEVPPNVFMPQPNVSSAVLQLHVRKEPPVEVVDEEKFFALVRACFAHRRKTLRNNLIHFYKNKLAASTIDHFLKRAGIEGSRRGESLTLEEFASLANPFLEK